MEKAFWPGIRRWGYQTLIKNDILNQISLQKITAKLHYQTVSLKEESGNGVAQSSQCHR